jgi:hypothetical protein
MNLIRSAAAAAALSCLPPASNPKRTLSLRRRRPARSADAPILETPEAKDAATYARPLEARVYHVALDLNVDFDDKRIGGTARWTSTASRTPRRSSSMTRV